jgi:hypothetical protein
VAPGARAAALARLLGAPEARLVEAEGLDQPGQPVRVDLAGPVPLELPLPAATPVGDGSRWTLPWAGEWSQLAVIEGAADQVAAHAPAAAAAAGGSSWRRDLSHDGADLVVQERLRIEDHLVSRAEVRLLGLPAGAPAEGDFLTVP